MALCSCGVNERRKGQRTCQPCHTAYIKKWRLAKGQLADADQKRRERCRSKANYNRRLGALVAEPICQSAGCTCTDVQMVHPDVDRPLEPLWLCREHRVVFNRERRERRKVSRESTKAA